MKTLPIACAIALMGFGSQAHSQLDVQIINPDKEGHVGDTWTYQFQLQNLSNQVIQLEGFDPGLGDPGFTVNGTLLDNLYAQTGDFVIQANSYQYLNAFDVTIEPDAIPGLHYGLAELDFIYNDPITGQPIYSSVSTSWSILVDPTPAPEPATMVALGAGILAFARRRCR